MMLIKERQTQANVSAVYMTMISVFASIAVKSFRFESAKCEGNSYG